MKSYNAKTMKILFNTSMIQTNKTRIISKQLVNKLIIYKVLKNK